MILVLIMADQEDASLISGVDTEDLKFGVPPSVRPQLKEGMSFFGVITSIMATTTGAGLVFMPFRMYMVGIPAGLAVFIILSMFTHLSVVILMKIVKLLPIQIQTIYDLGYVVTRR